MTQQRYTATEIRRAYGAVHNNSSHLGSMLSVLAADHVERVEIPETGFYATPDAVRTSYVASRSPSPTLCSPTTRSPWPAAVEPA